MRTTPIAAVLLVSLALMAGCTTYAGSRMVLHGGGALIVAGTVVALLGLEGTSQDHGNGYITGGSVDAAVYLGAGITMAGVIASGLGIIGMEMHPDLADPDEAHPQSRQALML